MHVINKNIYHLFFSVFFLYSINTIGQIKEKSNSPKTFQELQSAIEKVLNETQTPAAGLVLVNGEESIWITGLGTANIENEIKANENTMFRIGSTSKMFISLAVLKLQEEGRISLKLKVRDLVPEIEFKNSWSKTSPILVEHLLEHTTGWDDFHITEYAHNDPKPLSLKEALDFHPHSRISRWIPGTRMAYSNSGPSVAAYIVEKITGQSFEDYVQENFFQPMGMETMTYSPSQKYNQLGATLYINESPQDYWHIIMRPSGSINASSKDMAKMIQFFINRGKVDTLQLLSTESINRMEVPTTSSGAKKGLEDGYGLSNYSSNHEEFVYRSHNGGVNGGLSDFAYLPEYNMGYAVMINSGSKVALKRITKLIRDFQTKDLLSNKRKKTNYNKTEITISGYYEPINPRSQTFHFLQRILNIGNIEHFYKKDNFLFKNGLLGGSSKKYEQENSHSYKSDITGKTSIVQVIDPIDGEVIHLGSQVLKPVSAWIVFGRLAIFILWILLTIRSVIKGILRSIKYLIRKNSRESINWIRLLPFITSLIVLIIFILFVNGASNPLELFGRMSFISISLMIFTICFALASVYSMYYLIKYRKRSIVKSVYRYSMVLSTLHFTVTCYLMSYGVIGIQLWR